MANVWQQVFEVLGYALLENLVLIVCSDDDDMMMSCSKLLKTYFVIWAVYVGRLLEDLVLKLTPIYGFHMCFTLTTLKKFIR